MALLEILEQGRVREIKDSIAKVTGLFHGMNGQMLDITPQTKGMVMGFDRDEALVLMMGKMDEVRVGQTVYNRRESFQIPAGDAFLGRIVTALAEPCDGKRPLVDAKDPQAVFYPIFRDAPGVLDRIPITEALETGILMIDAMIPIGKGQRELIIGDRMSGKTALGVDAILNQKGKDVVCIYCCIGRSFAALKKVVETLKTAGAMDHTIVVSATSSASTGEQYLAPYTACALGEYFMDRGRHVLVVFDDLTKHAWSYRQISLLMERSPGRDAYPGDIFYIHSQMMERAGKLKPEKGGGSMSFLPIADTMEGDITGYVPSNLVSMTDGQIYLGASLFNSGFKPAIDIGLSVSRIGNKAQSPAMKKLSPALRMQYIRFRELSRLTRFQASVSDETREELARGEVLTRVFVQDKERPRPLAEQLLYLYALQNGALKRAKDAERMKAGLYDLAKKKFPDLIGLLANGAEWTAETTKSVEECLRLWNASAAG